MTTWTRSRASLAVLAACCAALLSVGLVDARRRPAVPPAPETFFTQVDRNGCGPEQITQTELGAILRQRCPLTARTQEDYGRVEIRFDPPSAASVVTRDELLGTIGSQLDQRLLPDARSATLVLDVYTRDGSSMTKLTSVALMTFQLDERQRMTISTDRQLRDGPITAYFPIDEENTIVAVSTRLAFSRETKPQIVARIAQITSVAVDFGGHGWLANAMGAPAVQERLSALEQLFVGSGLSISESATADMRYRGDGWQRLTYRFGTNPRNLGEHPMGTLTVLLTRSPSVFTGATASNGRANFGVTQPDQYDRYLRYGVTGSTDIRAFLNSNDGSANSEFNAFNAPGSGVTAFDSACGQVWRRLGGLNLSAADRRALFWALAYQTENRTRKELWTTNSCLSARRAESVNFGLLIPTETAPPPVSDNDRDTFFGRASAILRTPPYDDRRNQILGLFGDLVDVDFAPNTIFPAARTPPPGSAESRTSMANILEDIPMQTGCRFANPPSASGVQTGQQMGFLVRLLRPLDNPQVLTAVVRVAKTPEQDTHITGIALRPTTSEDMTAINSQRGLPMRCYTRDPVAALPPPAPPAAATPTPTP